MIAWLGAWLRDIIAVILLAVFIELLIPNKTMLRYTRLVIGLFILLTMMSPVLKLLQGDIQKALDSSMQAWAGIVDSSKQTSMPSLEQIQRKAQQISDQRDQEAMKLTQRALEASIREELVSRMDDIVEDVAAELKWVQRGDSYLPEISSVIVTLKHAEERSENDEQQLEVEAVVPVMIDVDSEPESGVQGPEAASSRWEAANPAIVDAVRSVIVQKWGAEPGSIVVRQPAAGQGQGEGRGSR